MGFVTFFDLVGTLVRPRAAIGTQYAAIAARFVIDADAKALNRAFPGVLARSRPFALPGPGGADLLSLEKRAWRAIVEEVFREAGLATSTESPNFNAYFDHLFDHFATRAAWDLYPDVVPALAALKGAGLRVGLVSNFDSRVYPLLERLGIAAAFDSVTIPANAGAAKPDPAIFRRALGANNATAEEAAYVGDSVEHDLIPAKALGMAAILIDRSGRRRAPAGVRRIRSLAALPRILGPG